MRRQTASEATRIQQAALLTAACCRVCALLCLAACLLPSPARAVDLRGALGVSTLNVWRGLDYGYDEPSLIADAELRLTPEIGLGTGLNSIGRGEDFGAQWLLYANAGVRLGDDWAVRAIASRYDRIGNHDGYDYRYDEFTVAAGFRDRIFASVSWIPEMETGYYRPQSRALAVDAVLRWPLRYGLDLRVSGGHIDFGEVDFSYRYGGAGLGWARGGWQLSLDWINTDQAARDRFYSRAVTGWVATVVRHF